MNEPTELERAVARAILARRSYSNLTMSEAHMLQLLADPSSNELAAESVRAAFLDARAAIAEVFRHKHTDRSVPCPLCGFGIEVVEKRALKYDDDEP